jgi:trehalose-phosphatase
MVGRAMDPMRATDDDRDQAAAMAAVRSLARLPVILIACDYDGTLAPIVDDPASALPCRESVAALRALAALPDTHVAVISGRSLRDLAALSRLPSEVHLVGSHGSEFDVGFVHDLSTEVVQLRERVGAELDAIAAVTPGATIERKPASVALHVRRATPEDGAAAADAAIRGPGAIPGVHVKHGKMVVELTVVSTDKGQALDRMRSLLSVDAAIFLGDDVTDEDAFAVLRGPDVGVKVGDGLTRAGVRVPDTDAVARILACLAEERRAWIEGAGAEPIERHSMLSDLRTVALVQPDARITWLCHPRADSPAVFAQLLGGPAAGYFAVRPESGRDPLSQRYLPDSLVLETRWPELTVTDYLDRSAGTDAIPGHTALVRLLGGYGRAVVEFAPRLDFGRAPTRILLTDDGLEVTGTIERLRVHSPGVSWEIVDDGPNQLARATVALGADPVPIVVELGVDSPPGAGAPRPPERDRRVSTIAAWAGWARRLRVPPVRPDLVLRSALVLKGLCHEPSGAILAAATTSLPEVLGGVRNWDYRFCWPRDASMTASALLALGSADEAVALLDWLIDRVEHLPGPEQLRPVYPLVGDEYLPEAVIPTLHGYRGSRPVRIGNAAEHQVQLDVFGPIVDLVDRLTSSGLRLRDRWWWLVEQMAEAVGRRWHEPDHGIWEERRPQRHHVHSKVMCWMTLDRAIAVGVRAGRPVPDEWPALRDRIAADVLEHGWNDVVGAFTIAYGDDELDAAALHIGLSGLLAPHDPRFESTVACIERTLRDGPVVHRYLLDDGLPGREGGFHVCTAWLIEAYVLMGRTTEAALLFERLIELVGPTGLLSEQYDADREVALGNHPQAYSHLGLVNAAVALGRAGPG